MGNKFYIADLHYGHKNVLNFDNRPFNSIEEMNEELVKRWNRVVTNGDQVYILGDMFWCEDKEAIRVLDMLNGQKILVRGNHDRIKGKNSESRFVKVAEYMEIEDNGRKIVLCHYPIPCFKNHFYGSYHLYGHVHNSFEWTMMLDCKNSMESYGQPCQMYNVGVMMPYMDYTPRTLDEIVEGYIKWAEGEE